MGGIIGALGLLLDWDSLCLEMRDARMLAATSISEVFLPPKPLLPPRPSRPPMPASACWMMRPLRTSRAKAKRLNRLEVIFEVDTDIVVSFWLERKGIVRCEDKYSSVLLLDILLKKYVFLLPRMGLLTALEEFYYWTFY